MNKWMNEWTNEWMNEGRLNEWIKCMNEWSGIGFVRKAIKIYRCHTAVPFDSV